MEPETKAALIEIFTVGLQECREFSLAHNDTPAEKERLAKLESVFLALLA